MKLYSNEIVFRGHPDKCCDQISDAILDAYLEQDSKARCAIETLGGKDLIVVTGEVTSTATVDTEAIIKRVMKDIGYGDCANIKIINNIGKQSSDIALGTNDEVGGAGDQGMMFGYACNDTTQLLPVAMVILQKLARAYDELRMKDTRFLPDGKSQITGYYNDKKLEKIKTFTISYQNTEVEREETDKIIKQLATDICGEYGIEIEEFLINPTGKFLIGGFEGDAGLTGRKIVVDQYQSFANVGGGAFSGKDATKVDRSGAYAARELAKEILVQNLNNGMEWCEVQISYAIGVARPLAIYVTSNIGDIDVNEDVYQAHTPANIISRLQLNKPGFEERAKFGHFSK